MALMSLRRKLFRHPFLVTRRNYPLRPRRLLLPLADGLAALGELCHGVSAVLALAEWTQAADALQRAAEILRDAAR